MNQSLDEMIHAHAEAGKNKKNVVYESKTNSLNHRITDGLLFIISYCR